MGRIFGKIQFAFITVLLFALNGLAGGAVAGKVTIVKGQVFIVRGGEKIQVKKDITVLESDVIESQPGGTARITMIDSNLVDVYPKSKVEIAKYVYKPNQDQKDVELKVDFGKIKSTVNQKYDGAKNKFQVKTPSAVAGVRGTVFTAEYDVVKKVSRVITIEGLVAVTKIIDRERQTPPVFVRPDQVVKVDAEQAKTEQPRDLKSEEREERKQEDKDLGYQYDPKKEPTPAEGPSSRSEPPPAPGQNFERPEKDVQVREPVIDLPSKEFERPERDEQARQPIREVQPVRELPTVRELPVVSEQPAREIERRETPPVKEISIKEPVRADREDRREDRREERQAIREVIKDVVKNVSERRQERQQEQQEKRQAASEDQQAKKQKQTEDEQAKKQKQMEEEQARKQKQTEEEQAKKQKQMEEEQARKQKQTEEEQNKKQKQMEEEQARKQKQLEEEQAKKQQQMDDMLAAKRKHAEEAQAKREEEQKKRLEEQQARRAELARRLAEIAKRTETTINRLPSGSTGGTTTPTSPINTLLPGQ